MGAVSEVRQQGLIGAPREVVWEVITDVERHPEWWPDAVEVECEEFGQGCTYREVMKVPLGTAERRFEVQELDEPSEFRIRCVNTGAFVHLSFTDARGETFVEAAAGMEPTSARSRLMDVVIGRLHFGHWLKQWFEALDQVAGQRAGAAEANRP